MKLHWKCLNEANEMAVSGFPKSSLAIFRWFISKNSIPGVPCNPFVFVFLSWNPHKVWLCRSERLSLVPTQHDVTLVCAFAGSYKKNNSFRLAQLIRRTNIYICFPLSDTCIFRHFPRGLYYIDFVFWKLWTFQSILQITATIHSLQHLFKVLPVEVNWTSKLHSKLSKIGVHMEIYPLVATSSFLLA